jgi:hypothetical protein
VVVAVAGDDVEIRVVVLIELHRVGAGLDGWEASAAPRARGVVVPRGRAGIGGADAGCVLKLPQCGSGAKITIFCGKG